MSKLREFFMWVRFGKIAENIKSIDGGVVSEIEFVGRKGRRVGYWAYGSFDPSLPFQGYGE